MTPENFQRIRDYLVCPGCKGDLEFEMHQAQCKQCAEIYPMENGKIFFITPLSQTDELDIIKGRMKNWFGSLYHKVLRPCLSPSFPFGLRGYLLAKFDLKSKIVIDLGSGNNKIHEDVFTVDVMNYENVDIVCDMRRLPFRAGSIDVFGTSSALEHVPELASVLAEIDAATRPGGRGIHITPFMYPFHASPNDFVRFTHAGAAQLFEGWKVVDQFSVAGPFSLFNSILAEFLSIIFSMGSKKLQAFTYLILCALLAPIKFLDVIFLRRRAFISISAVILTDLQKPA
jgi:SAM-dependent methyltransferase